MHLCIHQDLTAQLYHLNPSQPPHKLCPHLSPTHTSVSPQSRGGGTFVSPLEYPFLCVSLSEPSYTCVSLSEPPHICVPFRAPMHIYVHPQSSPMHICVPITAPPTHLHICVSSEPPHTHLCPHTRYVLLRAPTHKLLSSHKECPPQSTPMHIYVSLRAPSLICSALRTHHAHVPITAPLRQICVPQRLPMHINLLTHGDGASQLFGSLSGLPMHICIPLKTLSMHICIPI